jgi:hypothetical protein
MAKGPIEDFGQKMAILANANEEALWINGEFCYVVFIVWENDVLWIGQQEERTPEGVLSLFGFG